MLLSSGKRIYGLCKFLNGILKKCLEALFLKDHFLYLPIFLPRIFFFFLLAYRSFVSKSLFLGAQIMIITNGNLG